MNTTNTIMTSNVDPLSDHNTGAPVLVAICLATATICLPFRVSADPLSEAFLSRTESKLLRREATQFSIQTFALEVPAPEKTLYSLTLGVAYSDGEDGSKSWNGPFELDAQLPDRRTILKLAGDGYARVRSTDGNASGFNKIILGASHALPLSDTRKIVVGAGVALPTGGDLGGSSASQYLLAGTTAVIGARWQLTLVGKGIRSNASPADGVSRFTKAGVAQAKYLLGDNDLMFSIDRSQRSGAGGQTNVGIATDIQITKAYALSFGVTRGITAGARDTSVEIDISRAF